MGQGAPDLAFTDADGKVLLQEIENGGALQLKARQFKTLPGGSFSFKGKLHLKSKRKNSTEWDSISRNSWM